MIAFDAFLREARGHDPYPWQLALAERLADEPAAPEDGPRPLTIAVPTGSGKTTVVDALVWALAAQADRPPRERTVGTRIVWAIDRRILVDEVHAQTDCLARRLTTALTEPDDALHEVAARLERLKGVEPPGGWTASTAERPGPAVPHPDARDPRPDGQVLRGTPLVATRWRGGISIGAIGQHPLQVEVITSTVAQIGSRLLFRGYGLSDRSLPLGAALAACDTTICLDEAHLAEPFADTVRAIGERRREHGDTLAPAVRLLRLSATSGDATEHDAAEVTDDRAADARPADDDPLRIDLSAADEAHPALRRRLEAPKLAALVEPDGPSDKDQELALLEAVTGYVRDGRRIVACVVNSVRTARAVYDRLCKQLAKEEVEPELVLLVGPQRPADRRHSLERAIDRATPAGDAAAATVDGGATTTPRQALLAGVRTARPLVVVATQTFEVGLDADVDALVTQSASATAIVQRLGRLNRTGRLNPRDHADRQPGADHPAGHATIVRHVGFPLYAEDEERAWRWLSSGLPAATEPSTPSPVAADAAESRRAVDVSVAALRATPPPPALRRAHAAELTDQAVELLTQTSPRPHRYDDPDIDAFLRGVDSEPDSDVSVCWRSDLAEDDLTPGADAYRAALLRLAPPHRDEQLTLSIGAARNLLAVRTGQARTNATAQRRLTTEVPDVEGEGPPLEPQRNAERQDVTGIPFLVRRGDELLRGRPTTDALPSDVGISDVRPGDLLILPSSLGGVDADGLFADEPRTRRASRTTTDRDARGKDTGGSGKDVGRDVRPPTSVGPATASATTAAADATAAERPTPVRLTFGALDEAYATVTPRPGPRAQRVRRLLRRIATIERRIDDARTDPGRERAFRDLFTALTEHPAFAPATTDAPASPSGPVTIAGLDPGHVLLRRLTPDLPSELTDPTDDPGGLILGVPTIPDDASLFFGDDPSNRDEDEERPPFEDAGGYGPIGDDLSDGLPGPDDGSTGGVLLSGEDPPMATGGWVLLPVTTTAKDRVRPRNQAPPTLAAHARAVADRTAWFATAAGLPEVLVRTLVLAARAHDHGKADPRMQAFFRGGTLPPLAEAIAKSVFGTDDRRADRTARLASGLPTGWRHELASAVILADAWANDRIIGLPEIPGRGVDIDLALLFVDGHHGAVHPVPPVPGPGAPPRSFAIDVAGVAGTATGADAQGWDDGAPFRRLERLTARYGVWTLAYLQSLLVLADRTVSAEGR